MKHYNAPNKCNSTQALDVDVESISSSSQPASDLTKRNVTVDGKRTTIRLEPTLWHALENIARLESTSINQLCSDISTKQHGPSFTSAVRVFIVHYYMYAGQQPGVADTATAKDTQSEEI